LKGGNCPTFSLNGKQIPQGETAKYLGYLSRQLTDVANSHICQKKTSGAGIPTNLLDARKKIGAINKKQVTAVQHYSKTHLDIRYTDVGHCQ